MRKVTNGILCTLLFLLCLTPLFWFPGNSILLGYDNIYPLNPLAFLQGRMYSWSSTLGFSMDQSGIQGSLLIHFIDSLPQLIGFSPQMSQKILYCFWFFLLLFSPFVLMLRLEKYRIVETKYARYFFPVLYAFNFYMLQAWWIAERTKFSVAVATPLILSIMIEVIVSKPNAKRIAGLGILSAFILSILNGGGWQGISLYGGLLAAMFCFFVFFAFLYIGKREFRRLFYSLVFFFVFGSFYLLFNAYTIVPFISTTIGSYRTLFEGAGGYDGLIRWSQYISEHTSFINLLRLQGIPDWYGNIDFHPYAAEYLKNPIFIALSFVFPALLFFYLFQRKKDLNPIIVYFMLLLVISLFLTAGSHRPLGVIFDFMVRNIPGFIIFRSPIFKFGYIYWLTAGLFISVSLSYGLESILIRIKKQKVKIVVELLTPILVILSILLYYHPYFTKNIFRIDETSVSSRVTIPPYIHNFSTWWQGREKDEKVLLLPKLNEGWFFEIYKWNYLSLNPVLANFGSHGIIENTVLLSEDEKLLLGQLYNSISERDYKRMDTISSILGIRYFLVRDDFFFDFPGRETDNPQDLTEKILGNSSVKSIIDFEKWHVYGYNEIRPQFYSVSQADIVEGSNGDFTPEGIDTITLAKEAVSIDKNSIKSRTLFPECISCGAEKELIQVSFPKPRIFPGSNSYEFVKLKERLSKPKHATFDQELFLLVGNSVKHIGQLSAMMDQGKDDYSINVTGSYYTDVLDQITEKISQISSNSKNPYSTAIILDQYLSSEQEFLGAYTAHINRKNTQLLLENIVYRISKTREGLKKYYNENDINITKIYSVNVSVPGNYDLQIPINSLGHVLPTDISQIFLVMEKTQQKLTPKVTGETVDLGSVLLHSGINILILHMPPPQNVLSVPIKEQIAERNCYSSFINDFSRDKFYDLRFIVKNNFDQNFFFFVDDAIIYSPLLLEYFSLSGEQEKQKRYVLSATATPANLTARTLRIAFCAPSLTEDRFKQNISQLSIKELSLPELSLTKIESTQFDSPPYIDTVKESPVSYRIAIRGATAPFFLVGTDRFSPGWQANVEAEHYIANRFTNAWYIKKDGDFRVRIEYKPQKYVIIGSIISLGGIVLGVALMVWMLRNKGVKNQ